MVCSCLKEFNILVHVHGYFDVIKLTLVDATVTALVAKDDSSSISMKMMSSLKRPPLHPCFKFDSVCGVTVESTDL